MITPDKLLEVFVELADTLIDDYDVVDFLQSMSDHVAVISGASVGLLLRDQRDELQFMAASTQGARHLELFQLQGEQGPCLDCFRTGVAVIVPDLNGSGGRWPSFAPRATELGFRSVHAFPLRLRQEVIGALNVFSEQPLPLLVDEVRTIQALADVATIAIIQQRSIAAAVTLTDQLQVALDSRIVIEQAKGVVARGNSLGVDDSFTLIRAYARSRGLRLFVVARDIVSGELDPTDLAPRTRDTR